MLSAPNRVATRSVRFLALLGLAGALAACDLIPDGGYDKIVRRDRSDYIAVSHPAPPPVVPGLGGGGGGEVPTLPANPPAGVTQAMVEEGSKLFGNPCSACHGPGAQGTPAAPSLADAEWLNISGNYDEIVNLIHTGVPAPKAHPGAMPPLGGGTFSDEQVRQLAAYVFALSHQGS